MENLNKVVSRNLIKFRLLAGLTQKELAKKINYSDKSISKWERGDSLPDLSVLVKLSEIYNVDLNVFIDEKTEEQKIEVSNNYTKKKHFLTVLLSAGLVWFIATIVFVVLTMIDRTEAFAKLSFVYAIPISALVVLIFSTIWGNDILNLIFSSITLWGTLISVCLSVNFSKIWNICYIGIIVQAILGFWFGFRIKYNKKTINVKK